MRRIVISLPICLFLLLATPSPSYALSWSDLFPWIQMQSKTEQANPKGNLKPDIVSDKYYSNTNTDKVQTCSWSIPVTRDWDSKKAQVRVGTDPKGQPIYEEQEVEYDPQDAETSVSMDELSNKIHRNTQYLMTGSEIKTEAEDISNSLTSYTRSGYGASRRLTPFSSSLYEKGQLIKKVVMSLDQLSTTDVVECDEQLVWSCGGGIYPISQKSKSDGCRPVTISEIAKYYKPITKTNPRGRLIYSNMEATKTESYPDSKNFSNYESYYQKNFGTAVAPLSGKAYETIYNSMTAMPKCPVNTKVEVTRYDGYNTDTKQKTTPNKKVVNRTLGNYGTFSSSQYNDTVSFTVPANYKDLPNQDACNSVTILDVAIEDKPSPITGLLAYIKGIFEHNVKGQYHFADSNEANVKMPSQIVDNAKKTEQFANFLPFSDVTQLSTQTFSSKISNNPPEPGYRANLELIQFAKKMTPYSQQKQPTQNL